MLQVLSLDRSVRVKWVVSFSFSQRRWDLFFALLFFDAQLSRIILIPLGFSFSLGRDYLENSFALPRHAILIGVDYVIAVVIYALIIFQHLILLKVINQWSSSQLLRPSTRHRFPSLKVRTWWLQCKGKSVWTVCIECRQICCSMCLWIRIRSLTIGFKAKCSRLHDIPFELLYEYVCALAHEQLRSHLVTLKIMIVSSCLPLCA